MNKNDIVKKVAETAGLSIADAKKSVDAVMVAVKDALVAGDKVQLIGFGSFSVKTREARQGVNPRTGEKITIAAKNTVKFVAGAEFDADLNK